MIRRCAAGSSGRGSGGRDRPSRSPGARARSPSGSLLLLTPLLLSGLAPLEARFATHGYPTRLALQEPVAAGASRVLSGAGAPAGPGVHVELWRAPSASDRARSLGSVEAEPDGRFAFPAAAVAEGDRLWATLSRAWRFESAGDLEGWEGSPDARIEARGGVLRIEISDGDGDGVVAPRLLHHGVYDPRLYRVLEARLRHDDPLSPSRLDVFWGEPWPEVESVHSAQIPGASTEFRTVLIPLDRAESSVRPGPPEEARDGLWSADGPRDILGLAPLGSFPAAELPAGGIVFEIDAIRLREDYRIDFDEDSGPFTVTSDVAEARVENGRLGYRAADTGSAAAPGPDGLLEPMLLAPLATGWLDPAHLSRLAVGVSGVEIPDPALDPEGGDPLWTLALLFEDRDSAAYRDDGGAAGAPVQAAEATAPLPGRIDGHRLLDELTVDPATGAPAPGEWSEDGAVATEGLRFTLPLGGGAPGGRVEIDYLAIVPESPWGPSDPVVAGPAPEGPPFARGDCNGDGSVIGELSDAITVLSFNFMGGPTPGCLAACDANGDGEVVGSVSDAIYLLGFNFLGGPAPPPPFPACGPPEPTDATLGCAEPPACP